jgi:hypothetical protein
MQSAGHIDNSGWSGLLDFIQQQVGEQKMA